MAFKRVQHQNFNRITQVTVIKLIVTNAMESHRRIRRIVK